VATYLRTRKEFCLEQKIIWGMVGEEVREVTGFYVRQSGPSLFLDHGKDFAFYFEGDWEAIGEL
jgi:hypothetical protein